MQDEYGNMDASGETYVYEGDFPLELNGAFLKRPQVRFNTWGTLNAARDNCVVVCHALTGNSRLDTWWGGLLGPGKAFDTSRYFVVCANVLGSCYGTTGPSSTYPGEPNGKFPYYGLSRFPAITIRDSVRLHRLMVFSPESVGGLGVRHVMCVVGGSMGGMQSLEWALLAIDDDDFAATSSTFPLSPSTMTVTSITPEHRAEDNSGLSEGTTAVAAYCSRLNGGSSSSISCGSGTSGSSVAGVGRARAPMCIGHRVAFGSVGAVAALAVGVRHRAWQIGVSECQRQAIYADPHWPRNGDGGAVGSGGNGRDEGFDGGGYAVNADLDLSLPLNQQPSRGLAVARMIAMVSYRTADAFDAKFGRRIAKPQRPGPPMTADTSSGARRGRGADPPPFYEVESYLRYQGQKFLSRFDAMTYVALTRLMDTHDVGRGRRGGCAGALARLGEAVPVLVVSVDSDVLYPPADQLELLHLLTAHSPPVSETGGRGGDSAHGSSHGASLAPAGASLATFASIRSDDGHDGFLLAQDTIQPLLKDFLGAADNKKSSEEGDPACLRARL